MMKFTRKQRRALFRIAAGGVLFLSGIIFSLSGVPYAPEALYIAAYLCVGADVLIRAVKGAFSARLLDENFLMAIATIGAFILGEFSEGVAVMLFYQVGELFQSVAVSRSRNSIKSLLELRADHAEVEREGEVLCVDPGEVSVGEIIKVKPGDRLPLDGVVVCGESELDTSALTGESLPRPVSVGDEVYSGTVNGGGVLRVRVTRPLGESTVSKILDLVENAASKKSKREAFITRFARWYTPAVVAAAVLIAIIPSVITGNFRDWIYRGLNFLVISCPCALVISVPLAFFGGIGAASKRGVLVKGGITLETLAKTDTVIFDKTGTLTEGTFRVERVTAYGMTREEVLRIAAKAEAASTHPIARSVVEAYGDEPDVSDVKDVHEVPGHGVKCRIGDVLCAVGGRRLLDDMGITAEDDGVSVYVVYGGKLAGRLTLAHRIKADAKDAVAGLRAAGVKRCVMLTGDSLAAAEHVASELSLDAYRAGLMPGEKVTEMERLLAEGTCAFVGDGINDAPVLSRADIGIAMGGVGSDAAIEAADAVIMDDRLSKIADAMNIARRTVGIATANTVFALGVKAAVMVLGIFGIANMWLAVFADVGVAVLAILNSVRIQK